MGALSIRRPSRPRPDPRRIALEGAIERLLAAVEAAVEELDALDGDADIEPALGAPERHCDVSLVDAHHRWGRPKRRPRPDDQAYWAQGGDSDELEDVSEDEGAECNDEGVDTDSEPDAPAYAADYALDQRLILARDFGGEIYRREVSPWGA